MKKYASLKAIYKADARIKNLVIFNGRGRLKPNVIEGKKNNKVREKGTKCKKKRKLTDSEADQDVSPLSDDAVHV